MLPLNLRSYTTGQNRRPELIAQLVKIKEGLKDEQRLAHRSPTKNSPLQAHPFSQDGIQPPNHKLTLFKKHSRTATHPKVINGHSST